jgi:hypothetical protein
MLPVIWRPEVILAKLPPSRPHKDAPIFTGISDGLAPFRLSFSNERK